MGACFSKPAPVVGQNGIKNAVLEATEGRLSDAPHARSASVADVKEPGSSELPTEVAAWSAADVQKWAASLGLPKTSIDALQGLTGLQLQLLTDQRLLQLGVKDAAERHALLAARSNVLQHEAGPSKAQHLSGLTGNKSVDDAVRSSATGSLAGALGSPGSDAQPDSAGSKAFGRFGARQGSRGSIDSGALQSAASLSGQKSDDLTALVTRGASFTQGAELLEDMKDMQVLRITANCRLFRHSRPVPVSLVPYCQALCTLHDLRRGAHYHYENCHQFLQRCVLVQDYLLALPHRQLLEKTVMLSQLSLLVQDAYDVFSQFSERGWLLRLLNSVRDQDDFNRLDQMLVSALEAAGVDTSEEPLLELKKPRSYAPQQQQLEAALKHLGGIAKLLRDPLSATIRLQSLLHHLPSGSNIDALLQQEIDHYLSSQLWFSDSSSSRPGSRENSFSRLGSAGSNGSNGLARGGSNGSGSGLLRRTSSLGARGRASLSVVEPFMVLRNDIVRTEWRQAFGGRERVTWREFWYKMVQPTAHIWGLDQQLDKFTTDYVQQHLQRGAHGLLTIAELDFAFPPNTSPATVIKAKLDEHKSSSSSLPAVTLLASARPKGPGGSRDHWLRMPQEPVPRLHNFPEFPVGFNARDDEVSELVLGMADVSTNLVMLTGAPGVGRSMLAASLAHDLVVTHHWTDAYWIDLQGVNSVVLAGQQLMAGLGLVSDVPDIQALLAWLEGRPRERFGIVLTHVQELLSAPAEEQHGFLDLLDNILHSSHKLQVVVVCDEPLPRITYLARPVEVEPLGEEAATQMLKDAQPSMSEDICHCVVEACQGAPAALSVICGLLRYGHCSASEFMRIYSDPSLPIERTISDTSRSSYLPFESRVTNERLQRILVAAMVALPDDLVTGLLVLSLLPAPFSFEMAAPLLALPVTNNERRSIMRRLVNLGLLSYNASLQTYTMHTLVRQAARLLVHNLGLPYVETRRRFAELLISSARHLVLPLVAKNKMLSARLAWSRISVHVVQLLNWAFQEVREDMIQMYVALAWDLMPLLSSSCGSHTLQGFCQVVVERAQFLDMNMESAQVMTALGALLAESGALKRADTLLRQALEFFWRELKGAHPAVARCYRELGALQLKAGKAAEGAKHLQSCLEMQEQLFGGLNPELLPVLQLQVELLRRSRKYNEAEGVCQRALGICGAAYGPADVQVAVWKSQLAQVVRQAGRVTEAQSLAQEALALLQSQLGSEHPRVATQLMMLGQLAAQQGKQAIAEQTYRKALQVYQTVSGLHHPDTFNCLATLVSVLRSSGKASHALPLAQRCLAVKKKALGELHPDTAASMQVVADVMLDLGRYADVESNCNRAVWVYQQLNQPANSKPVIVAMTMQALALVLLGRAGEAEQLATDCLEAAKQMNGPAAERNSFVASCYNCLGEALREMGRVADAEEAAREGLSMREKDLGPNHPIVAISLQTLGHILRMRQQLPEALEAAKRCEQLRASQAHGPPMAAALHLQALIYLDMGDLTNALGQGQAALAIRQKVLSSEHPDLAHSLTVVSEVLLMQGKHAEAETLISHAVQIFIAQLGSSHPATQRAHMLLKQATNPRTASMSMSMRLVSADLGIRSPSEGPSTAATRQPSMVVEEAAAAPEQVQVTVPVTDSTDLAPALDELEDSPATAAKRELELDGPPTAQFFGAGAAAAADPAPIAMASPVVPMVPSAGFLSCSPTVGNNISIASKINNLFMGAPASGSYAGFLSLGPESPVGKPALAPIASGVPTVAEEEEEPQPADRPAAADDAAAADTTAVAEAPAAVGAGAAASSLPAAGAPGLIDPSELELGRQFGQPVSLGAGDAADADAGTRAYNKVLHELTRRSSLGSEGAKGDLLASSSNAASAAAALSGDKSSSADSAAGEADAGQERSAAAAVPAADAAARDVLGGKDSAALDAAAEAVLTAEEDDKLKKLHGMGNIEDLRAFLREHGWQLSRLSTDNRDVSLGGAKARQDSRDSAYNSAASRAGLIPPRAPNGTAAAASDAPGRFRGTAEQKEGTSSSRRPPARHFSFIKAQGLEAVQESSSASLGTPLPVQGISSNEALEAATGSAAAGAIEQQMMPQQYLQQQRSMPEALPHWGAWQDVSAGEEQEAEAQDLYCQQMAAAETEGAMAALRREQDWVAAQQVQMRARGATTPVMGPGELAHRLRQLQQQYIGAPGDGYMPDEEAYAMQGMANMQQLGQGGWMQPPQYLAQGPRGRRRRESWDASYGPTHPMAQAAAAAAAQCGYNVSGRDLMQQQLELYQQQTAPVGLGQWQSQELDYAAMAAAGPGNLAPLQTYSSGAQSHCAALPGSGGSRGSIPSGAYYAHGGPAAAAAAAAAALQGQRSGGLQYSPLSPGAAVHPDMLHAGWAGGRGSGHINQLSGYSSGVLPKYPSNISNYSIGSARSAQGHQQDQQQLQAQQVHHHPEQAAVEDQQQQEQQLNIAAKARAALGGPQPSAQQEQQIAGAAPGTPATSARGDTAVSPLPTVASSRSAISSTAPGGRKQPKRNVSFKQQAQAAVAGDAAEQPVEGTRAPQLDDGGSPRADAAGGALRSSRSAGSGVLRPKSPLVQQGMWDEQQQQQHLQGQHSPRASAAYSGPLYPEASEGESLDPYHAHSAAYPQQQLARPMTAGSQAPGTSRPSAYTPTGQQRATPGHQRNRSLNMGQQAPWETATPGDASRQHQQLLLQQQVLQVQQARLELQQQQLEIEQLLSEQAQQQQTVQQQHMQLAAQWPPGAAVPPPVAVAQQHRGASVYYPGPPVAAPHIQGLPSYPLQQTTSSASTASIHSPASPVPHQVLRGTVMEQAIESNMATAPYSYPAHLATGPSPQSSMLTAGSSYVPSSPSASSSLSSRPPLSRGTSDNHEGQVAAAAAQQQMQQSAAAMAAARNGQRQQPGPGVVMRPGSPDRTTRTPVPLSGPPSGGSRQLQQAMMHRLHRDNSHEQPDGAAASGPPVSTALQPSTSSQLRGQHMMLEQQLQQQQMLEQQLQQQQMFKQQLLQQQMALQMQQSMQQQVPTTALGRMGPGRQFGRSSPYGNMPMGPGGSFNFPVAGQQMPGQQVGYRGGPQIPLGGRGTPSFGLPGQAANYTGGVSAYGPVAGNMPGAGQGPPVAARVMSFVGGRAPFGPAAMAMQRAGPSFTAQAGVPAGSGPYDPHLAAQWAAQQQTLMQEHRGRGLGAGSPNAPYRDTQYPEPGPGTEDYEMWAAPPDYGQVDSAAVPSSGGDVRSRSGSQSRSFIAPGGGQYWEGRRSNSFGNLTEAMSPAVLGRQLVRSKSSEELPVAQEGDEQAAADE